MSWSAWPYCSRLKILDYRQIAQIQSTYVIGFADWIFGWWQIPYAYIAGFDPDWAFVWCGSKLQNIPVRWNKGAWFQERLLCQSGRIVSSQARTIHPIACLGISLKTSTWLRPSRGQRYPLLVAMVFGIGVLRMWWLQTTRPTKAVNWSSLWRISDFGLSNNLGVLKWSQSYIVTYFERFGY